MTPRERVIAAFEGRAYDQVPVFHAGFSSRVASEVLGRPNAHVGGGVCQYLEAKALWDGPDAHAEFLVRSFDDAVALTATFDQDLVREAYWRMPTKPDQRVDEFTFLYGDPDGTYVVRQYDPVTELYQILDQQPPPEQITLHGIAAAVERYEAAAQTPSSRPAAEQFASALRARDYFGGQRAVRAGGVSINIDYRNQAWMEAVALAPQLVGRFLMAQAVRGEQACDAAAEVGIRIMSGGGDFASPKGPFYSPASYRALWTPAIRRVTARTRANGQFHKYASDGNLWPVADDLFPHVDGYYELDQAAGMDLPRLRETYPHLVLFGGVNSRTLHLGSPAEVIAEVESAMAAAHTYGGIVVGCSNQLVAGTPLANVEAMRQSIERLRRA